MDNLSQMVRTMEIKDEGYLNSTEVLRINLETYDLTKIFVLGMALLCICLWHVVQR